MKIVVADKISERGLEALRSTGWQVAQPSPAELPSALADADALIVRSATRVTNLCARSCARSSGRESAASASS